MKNLSNIEVDLKKSVAYKKNGRSSTTQPMKHVGSYTF